MTLWAFFLQASLAESLDIDLWNFRTNEGAGLRSCLDWIIPYVSGNAVYEKQDISKYKPENYMLLFRLGAIKYCCTDYEAVLDHLGRHITRTNLIQLIYPKALLDSAKTQHEVPKQTVIGRCEYKMNNTSQAYNNCSGDKHVKAILDYNYLIRFQKHCDRHLTKIANPKNKNVFVIGSGPGTEILWCIRHGAKNVLGIDIESFDQRYVSDAIAKLDISNPGKYSMIQGSFLTYSDFSTKYDLVLSNNVFEHIEDVPLALSICRKLVKPLTGRIAIFFAPLYYSSAGSHAKVLEPWEMLWSEDDKIRAKVGKKRYREMKMLNRLQLSDLIDAIRANDFIIRQFSILRDRNLDILTTYLPLIKSKIDVSISDLSIEGISMELQVIE
jgi:SAM-dependent methyltransferase